MKRFRCENVKVKNTWATGFGFDFIQGGDFINCIAENCGRGRAISGTTRVGSGAGFGYGSGLFEEEKVRFINCVSENNYTYGFFTEYVATRPEVTYRSRGIQAVGCSASGNNYGFLDAGSNGALITSCVFSGNESAGFALDLTHASPGGGINGKLSNCVITKNGASGNGSGVVIATIGPGGYSIADNEIFGNEGPGIRISNSSAYTANTRLAFTGNRIHDNNGAAFRAARALPDKCRIDGNETWNNTAALEIIGAYTANNLRIRFNDFAESSSITQTLNGTIVVSNEGLSSRTPINPIATFAASTPGQVTLSWTAPMETADDYRVEWMNVPVGTWNTVSRTASPNTSQVITGLPSFTQVQFRVASIIGGSIGSYATTSATRLIPTALHADYYNRADQTLAGKSLPDGSNSTATWSDVDSAAWSILSNSIRPDTYYSGRKSLVMDAGSATGTVRAKFSSSGSGTDLGASGILVRYVDASNYIVVDMSSAGGWNLRKCVAGTYTTIAAVSASKNVGDVVIVQFTGSNYTVTVNDALPVTATDSTHATATRRGFIQTGITSGSRMKWDDFETWNIAG
jgi:hypothetical protein